MCGTILIFIKFNNFGTQHLNEPRSLFHSFCCITWHIFELLRVHEPSFNMDKYITMPLMQLRTIIRWPLIFLAAATLYYGNRQCRIVAAVSFYFGDCQYKVVAAATLYYGNHQFRKLAATSVYDSHDEYSTHELADMKHMLNQGTFHTLKILCMQKDLSQINFLKNFCRK